MSERETRRRSTRTPVIEDEGPLDSHELLRHQAGTEAGVGSEGSQAAAVGAAGAEIPMRQASLWGDAWRQLRKNPFFIVSAVLILLFTVMAVAPDLFTGPRTNCDLANSRVSPSSEHWFGYDVQGCDYYWRVIHGARVSVIIGLAVVAVDVLLAVMIGMLAGYYAGKLDTVISRIADIFFALPTILAGIVILSVFQTRGLFAVCLVLIVLGWPTMMRLMRASALSVKEMDYVQAARALGASDLRIMRVHILPNGMAPVVVYATITIGIVIAAEAALSFLGVGLRLPAISWGLMINSAQRRFATSPHLLFFPAIFLSTLVFSFILLGDALRDALDPKLR